MSVFIGRGSSKDKKSLKNTAIDVKVKTVIKISFLQLIYQRNVGSNSPKTLLELVNDHKFR